VAKKMGIPTARRDVFLDNVDSPEEVKKRLKELVIMAKRKGSAIGIGHATKVSTAEVLFEEIPKLIEKGIKIVPASTIVE
jgi:hypothetical protein